MVAGGVESMSQIPMGGSMMYPNPALVDMRPGAFTGMGLTAENVAERFNIGRDEQDEFGAGSQQKAEKAITEGRFKRPDRTVNGQETETTAQWTLRI